MTLVILTAIAAGLGVVGALIGLRGHRTALEGVLVGLMAEQGHTGRADRGTSLPKSWRFDRRIGMRMAESMRERGLFERELDARLALSNSSLEDLSSRCLLCGAVGLAVPVPFWLIMLAGGLRIHPFIPVIAALALAIGGALLPIAEMNAAAKRGRRHAMRVICSFLDLVVLGLAGGMGIESALLAAAQLGENAVSHRMVAALSVCRDTGEPPWEALARVGATLGIGELSEVAVTAGLAGTEGAKVRATLAARAASIRRHELADVEAEANGLTEKLFIPGAFLLVGFLIFIGYPAFTRIASGF